MNKFKLILLYLLFITLEVICPAFLKISNVAPDLSLIFVVFISLYYGAWCGGLTGFMAGIIKDSFSASAFGAEPFLFCLIGFLAGKLDDIIYRDSAGVSFTLAVLAATIVGITALTKLSGSFFIYILYTSSVAPLAFRFLKRAI